MMKTRRERTRTCHASIRSVWLGSASISTAVAALSFTIVSYLTRLTCWIGFGTTNLRRPRESNPVACSLPVLMGRGGLSPTKPHSVILLSSFRGLTKGVLMGRGGLAPAKPHSVILLSSFRGLTKGLSTPPMMEN